MAPARANQPWTVAEDRHLLELLRKYSQQSSLSISSWKPGSPSALAARELGRSTCAVQARYRTLRVVEEHRRTEGRAGLPWPDCLPPLFPERGEP